MDTKEFLLTVLKECQGNVCSKCAFHGACIHTSKYIGYEEIVDEAIKRAEKLNHERTYADDFFEKFPNAKKEHGLPVVCRNYVYGLVEPGCGNDNLCSKCWTETMPEEKK